MTSDDLKKKAKALPDTPGVYFFKDSEGAVIYIGKAKSLRNRVSSYFHASAAGEHPKVQVMSRKISDVDTMQTESEVDALLVEARLIRDVQPKYNVQLKDDKSYPLLSITRTDDFPRVAVTRERQPGETEYYGPFVDATGLRQAVKIMQRIFKFATCSLTIRADDEKRRYFRPCILHSIGRCTAPCADRISKEDYATDVESLRRFLKGEKEKLIEDLRVKMKDAAAGRHYERAGEYRDQIDALASLSKQSPYGEYLEGDITPMDPTEGLDECRRVLGLTKSPRAIAGIDIANLGEKQAVGSLVTFVDGVPFKAGYRKYRIKTVTGVDDYAMIREVVRRRFTRASGEFEITPDILLIDGGLGHLHAAAEALASLKDIAMPLLLSLAKKEEILFRRDSDQALPLPGHSPMLRLMMYVRDEAHRFAQHYHHILRRKSLFEGEE